jgi:hypothetical protein
MIPRRLPESVDVASKSGTDSRKGSDGVERAIRNDAAIVTTPGGVYVIAILTQGVDDARWTVDNAALLAGADVSRIVYDHFAAAAP